MRKETQGALFYGVGRNRKEDPMDYRSVQIDPSANIAPDCSILGHVTIGPDVTVFSGAALRGDYGNDIVVDARSNIQENCVFHVNAGTAAVQLGEGVTAHRGQHAHRHGCHHHGRRARGVELPHRSGRSGDAGHGDS